MEYRFKKGSKKTSTDHRNRYNGWSDTSEKQQHKLINSKRIAEKTCLNYLKELSKKQQTEIKSDTPEITINWYVLVVMQDVEPSQKTLK